MKKIVLVGTDEGSFDYNRNVDFQSIRSKEIQLQLHVDMVHKDDSDRIIMVVYTRYLLNKEQLLNYNISLNFKVEQWPEYIKGMNDAQIQSLEEVHRMLGISVGFLRGSLSLQERTTPLRGAFLPLINIEDLSKNINITRLTKEEGAQEASAK